MNKINHIADFSSLGGVQTYLYSLKKSYPNNYSLYNLGNNVLDIYKDNKVYKFKNIFSLSTFLTLKKNSIFIVHNLILSKKWIIIKLILKLRNCRIIYHEHGIAWHNPSRDKIKYKKRIEKLEKIIVNSKATKILLESFYKIDNVIKILSSPICIYEELNNAYKIGLCNKEINEPREEIIIGFIGRLEEHKNPQFLIKLAKNLRDKHKKEIQIEFIGSGTIKDNLKSKCISDNIKATFCGRVFSRRDTVKRWDFCIVPSIREPLGLVPGEMALLDTITLSSKVDGLFEMYPSSCNFLLIEMKKNHFDENNLLNKKDNYQYLPDKNSLEKGYSPSVEDCVNKINYLLENKEKKDDLLLKHKIFIRENFDISIHSTQLYNYIFSD